MSKYVYYNRNIWLCEELTGEGKRRRDAPYLRGRSLAVDGEKLFRFDVEYDEDHFEHPVVYECGNYKMFDDFEGLAEVGDMIKVEHTSTFGKNWIAFEMVDDITIEEIESGYYNSEDKWMVEIYKHIGKNFIRMAHKENGKWVIDPDV